MLDLFRDVLVEFRDRRLRSRSKFGLKFRKLGPALTRDEPARRRARCALVERAPARLRRRGAAVLGRLRRGEDSRGVGVLARRVVRLDAAADETRVELGDSRALFAEVLLQHLERRLQAILAIARLRELRNVSGKKEKRRERRGRR